MIKRNVSGEILPLKYRLFKQLGQRWADVEDQGGLLSIELPDTNVPNNLPHTIQIELYIRAGYPVGLLVRGIDCALDVQPEVSNTIIIKPRR